MNILLPVSAVVPSPIVDVDRHPPTRPPQQGRLQGGGELRLLPCAHNRAIDYHCHYVMPHWQ